MLKWPSKSVFFVIISLLLLLVSCVNTPAIAMSFEPGQKYFYNVNEYLNYQILGDGDISLVLLHGFGASLQTWNDLLPYLEKSNLCLILVDLKGFGFSSKPPDGDYSIFEQAKIIRRLLKSLELGNYYFVGHSFGGAIALLNTIHFIDEDPKIRPQGLILIDAAVYRTEFPFFMKYIRYPVIGTLMLSAIPAQYQVKLTLSKIIFDRTKVTSSLIRRYSFFNDLEGYNEVLIQTAKQIIPDDFTAYTDRYRDFDMRTLIIWGRQDPVLPLENGMRLAEELQNAELVILDQCGHNPQDEHPEVVAEVIRRFVKSSEE